MKGAELKAARAVLERLKSQDPGRYFQVEIDTNFLTDYLDVVERPIHLGIVEAKLEDYEDVYSFAEDVRLVFTNSMVYCQKKVELHKVLELAKRLLAVFETESEKCLRPFTGTAMFSARSKVVMSESIGEAITLITTRLRKHKYGKLFTEEIDLQLFHDYKARVGVVMHLGKLEARYKAGAYKVDVGGWVTDLRRIGANCVRYNTYPGDEFRVAGVAFGAAVEKELETRLRPVLSSEPGEETVEAACPRLLVHWEALLAKIEAGFQFSTFVGKVQKAYPFLHPIASYFESSEPVEDYLRSVPDPISIGEIVAGLMQGVYASVAEVDKDVERIFANCRTYYGPGGRGRNMHGDSDADYFCSLCDDFEPRWREDVAPLIESERRSLLPPAGKKPRVLASGKAEKLAIETLAQPSGEERPTGSAEQAAPAPPTASWYKKPAAMSTLAMTAHTDTTTRERIGAAAATVLAALKDHRMNDDYVTATPFLSKLTFPSNRDEYTAAIGGTDKLADLATIEKCVKQGKYSSLEAFGSDVQRCFSNARVWKTALERYAREGSLQSRGLSEAVVGQAQESYRYAVILQAVLEDMLDKGVDALVAESAGTSSKNGRRQPRAVEAAAEAAEKSTSKVSTATAKKRKVATASISRQPSPLPKKVLLGAAATKSPSHAQAKASPSRDDAKEDAGSENFDDGSNKKKGARLPSHPSSSADMHTRHLEPWRDAALKMFAKLSRHHWVKPDGEFGRKVMWHIPAVEAFPTIRDAYLEKISRPIDLGQISERLRTNAYATPGAFAADVVLVFDNAVNYNEAAKHAPSPPGEVPFAVKVYDVATHLRDWSRHLALEYLLDVDPKTAGDPKRGTYNCAISASDLRVARERDQLEARKVKQAQADADLSTEALESFVSATGAVAPAAAGAAAPAATAAAAPHPATTTPSAPTTTTDASGPCNNPVLAFDISPSRRLEARRTRDEVVWPSRLGYNKDAARDAEKVLRALRRKQQLKHSQWFEKPVQGVHDYATYVAEPTCFEDIEARLNESSAEKKAVQRLQLDPYENLSDYAAELRRVFTNALAYNGRFRSQPNTKGYHVVKAVDVLTPVLEDALYSLAVESYERIGRERVVGSWTKSRVDLINAQAQQKRELHAEARREVEMQFEQKLAEQRISTKKGRERTLRKILRLAVESLDVVPEGGDTPAEVAETPVHKRQRKASFSIGDASSAAHLVVDDERELRAKADRMHVYSAVGAAVMSTARPLHVSRDLESGAENAGPADLNSSSRAGDLVGPTKFRPFSILSTLANRMSHKRDGRQPRLLLLRQTCPWSAHNREGGAPSEGAVERRPFKRRRLQSPVLAGDLHRDDERIGEIIGGVDATSGDSDWFTLPRWPEVEARVFVSTLVIKAAVFVRCCVVLRRVDDRIKDLRDDRGVVIFETADDPQDAPSVIDCVIDARATQRRNRLLRGVGGVDRLMLAEPLANAVVAELASLPYIPLTDELAATPPLPSRRAGAVRALSRRVILRRLVRAGSSRTLHCRSRGFTSARCRREACDMLRKFSPHALLQVSYTTDSALTDRHTVGSLTITSVCATFRSFEGLAGHKPASKAVMAIDNQARPSPRAAVQLDLRRTSLDATSRPSSVASSHM